MADQNHALNEAKILAARLRRSADRIDHYVADGPRLDIRTLETDWTGWAVDILREFTSMVGNSRLGDLTRAAGDAQQGVSRE